MSLVGSAYGVIGLQTNQLQQSANVARGIFGQLKGLTDTPLQMRIDDAAAARSLRLIDQAMKASADATKAMSAAIDEEANALLRADLAQQRAALSADTLGQKFARTGQAATTFFQKIFPPSQPQGQAPAQAPDPNAQAPGQVPPGQSLGLADIVKGNLIASGVQRISAEVMNYGRMAVQAYSSNERLALSLQSLVAKEDVQTGRAKDIGQAMAGAADRAKALLAWNQQLAVESPFSQEGVAQAFRMATAYGFVTDSADKTLVTSKRLVTALINFTSATGGTEATMSRISLALGQVQAKGKLAGGEVLQLTDAGLNVRGILAQAFGKTTEEIVRMQEKGLIPANRAIKAIVESLEKDYGGAAKAQSATITGLLNSIGDLKQIALRELFGGVLEAARPFMIQVVDKLSDPATQAQLHAFGVSIGDGIKQAIPPLVQFATQVSSVIKPLLPLFGVLAQTIIANLGPITAAFAANKLMGFLPGLLGSGQQLVGLFRLMAPAGLGAAGGVDKVALAAKLGLSPLSAMTLAVTALIAAYIKLKEVQGQVEEGKQGVEQKVVGGATSYEDFEARRAKAKEIGDSTFAGRALHLGDVQDMTKAQFDYTKSLIAAKVPEEDAIKRSREMQTVYQNLAQAQQGLVTVGTGRFNQRGEILQNNNVQALSDAQRQRAEAAVSAIGTAAPEAVASVKDLTQAYGNGRLSAEAYTNALELQAAAIQQNIQHQIELGHYEDLEAARLTHQQQAQAEIINQGYQLAAQQQAQAATTQLQSLHNQELQRAAQAAAASTMDLGAAAATLDGQFHTGVAAAQSLISTLRELNAANAAAAGQAAKAEERQRFEDDRKYDPRVQALAAAKDPNAAAQQYVQQQQAEADATYAATQKKIAASDALEERTRSLGTAQQKLALAQRDYNQEVARHGKDSPEAIRAGTAVLALQQQIANAADKKVSKQVKTDQQVENLQAQSYQRLIQMREDFDLQMSRSQEDFEKQKRRLLAEGKIFEARQLEEDFKTRQRRAAEDEAIQEARQQQSTQNQLNKKLGVPVAPILQTAQTGANDAQIKRLLASGDIAGAQRLMQDQQTADSRAQQDAALANQRAMQDAARQNAGLSPARAAIQTAQQQAALLANLPQIPGLPGAPSLPGAPGQGAAQPAGPLIVQFQAQVVLDGQTVGSLVGPTVTQQLTRDLAIQLQVVGATQPVGANQTAFRPAT